MQLHAQHQLHLRFKNFVGDSVLQLGNTYLNFFNESFTIRNFKYYVSNIQLKDKAGKLYPVSAGYYLVNEADSSSKEILINYKQAEIVSLVFLLGVDSIRNISGVQTGALDPMKGMFWTWNSGYIMAKLEGKSSSSKALGNNFTYHVGGYKKDENVAKWIELPLNDKNSNDIYIKADALKWFTGLNDIRIADYPVCHEPGKIAMLIAGNYSSMFSIIDQQKQSK